MPDAGPAIGSCTFYRRMDGWAARSATARPLVAWLEAMSYGIVGWLCLIHGGRPPPAASPLPLMLLQPRLCAMYMRPSRFLPPYVSAPFPACNRIPIRDSAKRTFR
jgi:hypothetical protein